MAYSRNQKKTLNPTIRGFFMCTVGGLRQNRHTRKATDLNRVRVYQYPPQLAFEKSRSF